MNPYEPTHRDQIAVGMVASFTLASADEDYWSIFACVALACLRTLGGAPDDDGERILTQLGETRDRARAARRWGTMKARWRASGAFAGESGANPLLGLYKQIAMMLKKKPYSQWPRAAASDRYTMYKAMVIELCKRRLGVPWEQTCHEVALACVDPWLKDAWDTQRWEISDALGASVVSQREMTLEFIAIHGLVGLMESPDTRRRAEVAQRALERVLDPRVAARTMYNLLDYLNWWENQTPQKAYDNRKAYDDQMWGYAKKELPAPSCADAIRNYEERLNYA